MGLVAARAFAMSPLAAYSSAARTPCLIVRLIVASGPAPGALRTKQRKQREVLIVFGRFGETGRGDRTSDEAQPDRVKTRRAAEPTQKSGGGYRPAKRICNPQILNGAKRQKFQNAQTLLQISYPTPSGSFAHSMKRAYEKKYERKRKGGKELVPRFRPTPRAAVRWRRSSSRA